MRSLAVLFLATAAVTAIPTSDVVPEDTLVQYENTEADYDNAKAHVQTLMEAGKSDKECRDLATSSKKAIEDDAKADQKVLDALPDGSDCKDKGQGLVTTNKASLDSAKKAESDAKKALDKANAANVDFGKIPYNQLTPGQCGTFFNHVSYKNAISAQSAAKKKHDQAKGASAAAQKAYDDAVAAAAKGKLECLCRAKKAHDKAWTQVKASKPSSGLDWKTAHNVICVLDGTPVSKCKVPAEPKLKQPKLDSAAAAMDSTKCDGGIVWVKHVNMYSGGYAAGNSILYTLENAKAKCLSLGPLYCKAVTCVKSHSSCTVRGGSTLKKSPSGEVTYVPTKA